MVLLQLHPNGFAAFPGEPETIHYTEMLYQRDRADILELIERIATAPEESFILTSDERQCRYCVYRSFCERGVGAGQADELDDGANDESDRDAFDFSQAAEIAF